MSASTVPTPTYERTNVVRSLASNMTHVAAYEPDDVRIGQFLRSFWALTPPWATVCGVVLRGEAVVIMRPGTKVKCPRCKRLPPYTTVATAIPQGRDEQDCTQREGRTSEPGQLEQEVDVESHMQETDEPGVR